MNSKQLLSGLAVLVMVGVLFAFPSGGVKPTPIPEPEPILDALAQVAMNDMGTFAAALTENTAECAKRMKAGELKTTDAALAWWKAENDKSRYAAYQPLHDELEKYVGDVAKMADAMEKSAPGFKAAIKGQ